MRPERSGSCRSANVFTGLSLREVQSFKTLQFTPAGAVTRPQHSHISSRRWFDGLCTKSPGSGISLCNLCVLCVSVVCFCSEFINHRDTEDTEVAQRRARLRLFVQSRFDALIVRAP